MREGTVPTILPQDRQEGAGPHRCSVSLLTSASPRSPVAHGTSVERVAEGCPGPSRLTVCLWHTCSHFLAAFVRCSRLEPVLRRSLETPPSSDYVA